MDGAQIHLPLGLAWMSNAIERSTGPLVTLERYVCEVPSVRSVDWGGTHPVLASCGNSRLL